MVAIGRDIALRTPPVWHTLRSEARHRRCREHDSLTDELVRPRSTLSDLARRFVSRRDRRTSRLILPGVQGKLHRLVPRPREFGAGAGGLGTPGGESCTQMQIGQDQKLHKAPFSMWNPDTRGR
jgi:hypothetical protein